MKYIIIALLSLAPFQAQAVCLTDHPEFVKRMAKSVDKNGDTYLSYEEYSSIFPVTGKEGEKYRIRWESVSKGEDFVLAEDYIKHMAPKCEGTE